MMLQAWVTLLSIEKQNIKQVIMHDKVLLQVIQHLLLKWITGHTYLRLQGQYDALIYQT